MRFGEKLRELRERNGLTREKLADESGVTFGTIHGYEIGRRAPSFANVVKLAAALGVSCEAFSACEDVTGEAQADTPPEVAEEPERARGKRK